MTRARRFSGTVESTLAYNPFITAPPLTTIGVPFGLNLRTGRREPIDEYFMHGSGVSKSLMSLFVALKGGGKTTTMKFLALLSMMLQGIDINDELEDRRIHIDNRKPEEGVAEWANIVEALQCDVFRLKDMGLEILDPKTLRDEWARLLTAINSSEFVKNSSLDADEMLALRIAVFRISRDIDLLVGLPTLEAAVRTVDAQDIKDFYDQLDDRVIAKYQAELDANPELMGSLKLIMDRPSNVRTEDVQAGGGRVSKYLVQILDGSFGKMFSGRQSLRDYLTQPAALFDLSDVDARSVSFFETLRHDAMSAALAYGDIAAIPHGHVREEIQEEGEHPVALRAHAFYAAKSRAFHTVELSSTQYLGNMRIGEPGSMARTYSDQIFNGIDAFWLFQQSDDPETRKIHAELGLSPLISEASMQLKTGCAIVKYRERDPIEVQVTVPKIVLKLAETNAPTKRMLRRRPVSSDPRVSALLNSTEQITTAERS